MRLWDLPAPLLEDEGVAFGYQLRIVVTELMSDNTTRVECVAPKRFQQEVSDVALHYGFSTTAHDLRCDTTKTRLIFERVSSV